MSKFGEFLKERRREIGLSLTKFCDKKNVDPVKWSKMERGRVRPPIHEKLEEYAEKLELSDEQEEYHELFDLAHEARKNFTSKTFSDEEVANKLPVFLRTDYDSPSDGDGSDKEVLHSLKKIIRES